VLASALEANGLNIEDLVKWVKLPDGETINKEDALAIYAFNQEKRSQLAIEWGNKYSEQRQDEIIATLSDKEKAFVDAIIDMATDQYREIAEVYLDVDNMVPEQVGRYFSMRRQDDLGQSYSQELSTENNLRANIGRASLQKDMLKRRVDISRLHQKPIRTDFFGLLGQSMEKQASYIALEKLVRDMGYVFSGKTKESETLLEAIRQHAGKEAVKKIQAYIKLVARPDLWDALDQQHMMTGFMKFLYRNLGTAQLAFKLSTVLVQAEGTFRALGRVDPGHVLAAIAQASLHPNRVLDIVYERSPQMRDMVESKSIDPLLSAIRDAKHSRNAAARAWAKFIEAGFTGLKAANAWTIASVWKARYDDVLGAMVAAEKEGGPPVDEAQAIVEADDLVYRTQPSGQTADRAPIYWTGNPYIKIFLRFTDASNKMLNMIAYDMPQAVKEHHIGRAVGMLVSWLFGSLIVGAVRRKRLPKNGDELLEDALLGMLDLVPFGIGDMAQKNVYRVMQALGKEPTRAKPTRYGSTDVFEPVGTALDVATGAALGKLSSKEIWDAASLTAEYLGIPTPAVENYARSVYDWEAGEWKLDPREWLGKVPRGEK
jgi:hypothetical protein